MAVGWIEFEPDHRGLGEMLAGPEFMILTHHFAEYGASYARAIAPVDSGEYANSFEVVSGLYTTTADRRRTKRAMSELWNRSDHAAVVEWAHDHRVLGRTVDEIERAQL